MINIIIADDHQMFIDGLKSLLDGDPNITVVAEALNGQEVLDFLHVGSADIVLMDINMPVMDGTEATKRITQEFPEVKVLMLTMHASAEYITNLISVGAKGYILKNTGRSELVKAITEIANGGKYFSNEVLNNLVTGIHQEKLKEEKNELLPHLTKREVQILGLITQEFTTQEIAAELFISTHTVETHRKNLLSKLNAKNTAGLVKHAIKFGLV